MRKVSDSTLWAGKIILGCACFAIGFDLFLMPNGLNAGGLSGLAMVIVHLLGFGTVGTVTAVMNLPLFVIGGWKIGKRFLIGSLIGMLSLSGFIDLFSRISAPATEPLIGAIYGGAICGLGIGVVFAAQGSTGGSDIVVRLLKMRYQNVPIGSINICFDFTVAVLTGIVFRDLTLTLYSGIAIFVSGKLMDTVVYRFDYSKVAIIISKEYKSIANSIGTRLQRGSTFLQGWGVYSGDETKVVLTAVKKQQLAELKQLVVETDPGAFIIVQEAHQVLGDGFSCYSKDSL